MGKKDKLVVYKSYPTLQRELLTRNGPKVVPPEFSRMEAAGRRMAKMASTKSGMKRRR